MDVGDKVKLEPCPFCGGSKASVCERDNLHFVLCDNCTSEGPAVEGVQSQLAAAEAWNRRTPSASIAEDGLPKLLELSDGSADYVAGYNQAIADARETVAADRLARKSVKRPGAWKTLQEGDHPDTARLLDVILLNGVCLMDRQYTKIDWTRVADWRYAAPPLSSEPQAEEGG